MQPRGPGGRRGTTSFIKFDDNKVRVEGVRDWRTKTGSAFKNKMDMKAKRMAMKRRLQRLGK